ncbi:hypothetical protein VUJ46_20105 [Chryseobacterium sp. MYb264]|uniref:hypothetical protein n=1 Tax=Chryseobacterium sp. MYb264 TaxID=2745153 RepID=UPI002E0E669B|nr:hypothetical protein VUJ46_20105 [Chryseobacterium sp. MYb264]
MKNFVKIFIFLIGILFISEGYTKCPTKDMIINIGGIIFDSKTLLPIESAKVYNEQGGLIATTDTNGYFSGKLQYNRSNNGIKFKIRIEKKGYLLFTQSENWADTKKEEINVNYYFGIKKSRESSEDSFSQFYLSNDISFKSVSNNFKSVIEKLKFNNTINSFKKGNQNSFFEIDESYYLISNTGWLKLESPKSLININSSKKIPAENINSHLKRHEIKDILHTENGEIKIVTYKK